LKIKLHTKIAIDSCHEPRGYGRACSKLRGRTWFLEVWVRGNNSQLNKDGILYDFGNVKEFKDRYDHRFLNDIPPFDKINPTAENISMQLFKELKARDSDLEFKVRLYELLLYETRAGKETYCEVGDFE